MSLVKCKKCKKEVSSTAKFCPHCGEANKKQFCRECGKEMDLNLTSCPVCGFIVNENAFYNRTQQPVASNKGEKYEIALTGLICSFFVPIAGLIMGIIVLNANKGQKNDARTMGLIATIVSLLYTLFIVFVLVLYFLMFFVAFSLY